MIKNLIIIYLLVLMVLGAFLQTPWYRDLTNYVAEEFSFLNKRHFMALAAILWPLLLVVIALFLAIGLVYLISIAIIPSKMLNRKNNSDYQI